MARKTASETSQRLPESLRHNPPADSAIDPKELLSMQIESMQQYWQNWSAILSGWG
jgi:hypothetical protein